jgi:hypothetical protein
MKICFRIACLSPLLLMGLSCGSGDKPDVYAISIPNLHVDSSSSIVALELNINAGSVLAVQNIPIGWILNINDDVSWRTKIKGNTTLGAASLAADELKRLTFIVRRNETEHFQFDISGTATISKPFQKRQDIPLTLKDFSLAASE